MISTCKKYGRLLLLLFLSITLTAVSSFSSCSKKPTPHLIQQSPLHELDVNITSTATPISFVYSTSIALADLLPAYGYTTTEQKEALTFLLQQAGIIAQGQSFDTRFPVRTNKQELLKDILEFIQLTQKLFTIRIKNQERWETAPEAWIQQADQPALLAALKSLDVINEIPPTITTPDAVCMMGSTYKSMKKRLTYIHKLLSTKTISTENLILLLGERSLSINVDGTKEELLAIAQEFGMNDISALTEIHLAQKLQTLINLPETLQVDVIDTPAGDLPRPTTETTIMELLTWLQASPAIKSIVFISSQPNVLYQKAVITEVCSQHNASISFEVAGPQCEEQHANLQDYVGSVGSYLWAKTPAVLDTLGVSIESTVLQEAFKKLYEKNPVMSQHIALLCKDHYAIH